MSVVNRYLYSVCDDGGKVIFEGTSTEVAMKFDVSFPAISFAYTTNGKLKDKYTLKRVPRREEYTIKVHGKTYKGCYEELMKQTGFSRTTIAEYVKKAKEVVINKKVDDPFVQRMIALKRDLAKEPHCSIVSANQDIARIKKELGKGYTFEERSDEVWGNKVKYYFIQRKGRK